MKVMGRIEIEAVSDVLCDVCRCSTRTAKDGLQFATLRAQWGQGAQHPDETYELHLCEKCFFETVAHIKQERRIQNMFCEGGGAAASLGLVLTDPIKKNQ